MHKLMIAALATFVLSEAAPMAFAAEVVPCEDMLADLKAAIQTATLSEADMAKVNDLKSQGLERCKADDDAGADALFTEALAVIGK